MQKYVLKSPEGQRLLINQEEYLGLIAALEENKKYVVIQGNIISLAIAPSTTPLEQWFVTETERLANSGKRLCKKCFRVMEILDKCKCWSDQGTGEEQSAFLTPELSKMLREKLGNKFNFPELSEDEKLELQTQEIEQLEAPKMTSDGGYIDPESGETHYS